MKMPANVTSSPRIRDHQPLSPANVPEPTTRSIDCQSASPNGRRSPSFTPRRRVIVRTIAEIAMTIRVSRPSQPITIDGPRESAASNR